MHSQQTEPAYLSIFFRNEPEFLSELVEVASTEKSIPDVRQLAINDVRK